MLKCFKKGLFNAVLFFTNKYSSKPERERVFKQLTDLYNCIKDGKKKKGISINFSTSTDKFIIFSDQHKGAKNGADDFMLCEPNYLAALDHYEENNYFFISLGDSEELWENSLAAVKKHQQPSFDSEKKFVAKNQFAKIFGNHDLYWNNDPFASFELKKIFDVDVPIYEGVVLNTIIDDQPLSIFCTHGHQGDKVSDGNWLSKFFISKVWAPLQAFTKINPNTPAFDAQLKTLHNSMMYEWSSEQKDVLLITGHTHQPVFQSLTYIERLYRRLQIAQVEKNEDEIKAVREEIVKRKFESVEGIGTYTSVLPTYFNSGCCCFNDGDITGIEIADGFIRLIKWELVTSRSERIVLEEIPLKLLMKKATQ